MRTYAWVVLSLLSAGIGGAVATWWSMHVMNVDGPQHQADEVLRNLAALGGVLAGLCGGIAGLGRGTRGGGGELLAGLAVVLVAIVGVGVVTPGFLLAPFLLVVAPLQGLAALLGGCAAVALLWATLWIAGVRDRVAPGTPGTGVTAVGPRDAPSS